MIIRSCFDMMIMNHYFDHSVMYKGSRRSLRFFFKSQPCKRKKSEKTSFSLYTFTIDVVDDDAFVSASNAIIRHCIAQ